MDSVGILPSASNREYHTNIKLGSVTPWHGQTREAGFVRGTLTYGQGSVRLTSSLRYLAL